LVACLWQQQQQDASVRLADSRVPHHVVLCGWLQVPPYLLLIVAGQQ
jgi:hypothetical protein